MSTKFRHADDCAHRAVYLLAAFLFSSTALFLSSAGFLAGAGGSATVEAQGADCSFIRGNLKNQSESVVVDLNDAVEIPALLLTGNQGSVPACLAAADVNDNGLVELSDFTYLVNFRFNNGPPPPAPFDEQGVDPTPDEGFTSEPDARFSFRLGSGAGVPGNTGIALPLTLSNEVPVTGVTAAFEYDPESLRIDEIVTEEGTLLSAESAEYIVATFDNNVGFAFVAALKDFATPFGFDSGESVNFPAGEEQLIATVKCAVVITADKGTAEVSFVDGRKVTNPSLEEERPGIHNLVFLGNSAARPALIEGGSVEIRQGFIRADANFDKGVDISDAVFFLDWVFKSGSRPACADAADSNNDTRLDLSDAIWTLSFLFRGGPQPSEPYPQPGVDPTDDGSGSLGCEVDGAEAVPTES